MKNAGMSPVKVFSDFESRGLFIRAVLICANVSHITSHKSEPCLF